MIDGSSAGALPEKMLEKIKSMQPKIHVRGNKIIFERSYMCGSRERTGGPDPTPLENYKNIGFLSNTGLDPLKITKLPIQHSMLGQHQPDSETPLKWRFAGGPLMTR